jgi:hypothetical protein
LPILQAFLQAPQGKSAVRLYSTLFRPGDGLLAMQKVVGSSPIIRSSQARWKQRVLFARDVSHA